MLSWDCFAIWRLHFRTHWIVSPTNWKLPSFISTFYMRATFSYQSWKRKNEIYWIIFSFLFLGLSSSAFSQNNPEQGLPFISNYSPRKIDPLFQQTWAVTSDDNGIMYF